MSVIWKQVNALRVCNMSCTMWPDRNCFLLSVSLFVRSVTYPDESSVFSQSM